MRQAMIVFVVILLMQVTSPFAYSQSDTPTDRYAGPPGDKPVQSETSKAPLPKTLFVLDLKSLPQKVKSNHTKLMDAAKEYMVVEQSAPDSIGKAHGLTLSDYGAEAVQILGQIVVDRASAQAYDVLKEKLEKLLSCNEPLKDEDGTEIPKQLDFRDTCNVIKSVRPQDVATNPSPLYKAVATDGFRNVMQLGLPAGYDKSAIFLDQKIAMLILDAIIQAQDKANLANPEELVSEFVTRIVVDRKGLPGNLDELNPAQKTIMLASLTFVGCKNQGHPDTSCNYSDLVNLLADKIESPTSDIRTGAKSLTKNLLIALSRPNMGGSTRPQYHAAVAALFDATCMLESKQATGCDAPIAFGSGSGTPVTMAGKANTLRLARDVALAAIDGDSNGMIKNIQQVVDLMENNKIVKKNHARALAFCGGMLNYAATYTDSDGTNRDAHVARTKIMESLTKDMTNRTGREGDSIWSVGGSLRLAAGARFGRGSSYYGPISLPLGFGYQSNSGKTSFHAELSVLDIGQYVSMQQGGTVQAPKLADSLAPSATVGIAWGKQLPCFLAVTGGYSPQYKFKDTETKRGAPFAGVVFGMYVPFFDLN